MDIGTVGIIVILTGDKFMKITDTHIYFWHGIYSNWYPVEIDSAAGKFANTEQLFMWCKAKFFKDDEILSKILATSNPRDVKALGRLVKNYNDSEWDKVRFDYMVGVNNIKFSQHKYLLDQLLATGDKVIVEASPYDKVWGVGLLEDDPLILDEKNWKGQNLLGKALMKVRENFNRSLTFYKTFVKVLLDQFGYINDQSTVKPTDTIESLGADSLDMVELCMGLEEEFGIEIPDEDAEACAGMSVIQIVARLEAHLGIDVKNIESVKSTHYRNGEINGKFDVNSYDTAKYISGDELGADNEEHKDYILGYIQGYASH